MNNADIPEKYKKCTRSALNIIDYADKTEKKLRERLRSKGYEADAIDFAVEYSKKAGYLNEERFMQRAAESIACTKLYGKRRLIQELYQKGFKRETLEGLDLSEINFPENCAKRIKKTAKRYDTEEKLNVALLRYGYSRDDIIAAKEILEEEEWQ